MNLDEYHELQRLRRQRFQNKVDAIYKELIKKSYPVALAKIQQEQNLEVLRVQGEISETLKAIIDHHKKKMLEMNSKLDKLDENDRRIHDELVNRTGYMIDLINKIDRKIPDPQMTSSLFNNHPNVNVTNMSPETTTQVREVLNNTPIPESDPNQVNYLSGLWGNIDMDELSPPNTNVKRWDGRNRRFIDEEEPLQPAVIAEQPPVKTEHTAKPFIIPDMEPLGVVNPDGSVTPINVLSKEEFFNQIKSPDRQN